MSNETKKSRLGLALLLSGMAAAYGAETFIASGWSTFKRPVHNTLPASDETQAGHERINLIDVIDSKLTCQANTLKRDENEGQRSVVSIWLAPYRQFPEVPPEGGDPRGKGDYEYFLYLTKRQCARIASNYGSFKGSPADSSFKAASEQGLRAELSLAQRLGYDLFALDTRKSWVAKKDLDLCQRYESKCLMTSDGFILLDLKGSDELANNPSFLLNSTRMGIGVSLGEAIDTQSIHPVRASHWYPWEYPRFGLASRWNQGDSKTTSTNMPSIVAGNEAPAHLRTTIIKNPSIKQLEVELSCTNGNTKRVAITTPANKDISKLVNECLPRSGRVVNAIDKDGRNITHEAPQISKKDRRRTFYALMYSVD